MSKSALLKSSLAKKYWMAATGLFLCLFLVGHLFGNLQLIFFEFGKEGYTAFNDYAYFMTHNPAVKLLSYLTYFSILFHAIDGIMLTIQNNKARPEKYAYNKPSANSTWMSRYMAPLGLLILLFIIGHMAQFWAKMHFGDLPDYRTTLGEEGKDLYSTVIWFFKEPKMGLVWSLIYVVFMTAIAFHLMHGFASAFQSMGLNHKKYNPLIKNAGMAFAVLIPLGFALIPLYIQFGMDVNIEMLEAALKK